MKLIDLKTNIEETLGLDVISLKALVVCVNNCIAILHSKEYRDFVEFEYDIDTNQFPISFELPDDVKEILYVKVKSDNEVLNAKRMPIDSDLIQSRKYKDEYRMDTSFNHLIYYGLKGQLTIDSPLDRSQKYYKKIFLGYYKQMSKVPLNITEDHLFGENGQDKYEVAIREEFEDALTFYGLLFFANRFKFDREMIEGFNNTFRYFVEDMANQLDKEDRFYRESKVKDIRKL